MPSGRTSQGAAPDPAVDEAGTPEKPAGDGADDHLRPASRTGGGRSGRPGPSSPPQIRSALNLLAEPSDAAAVGSPLAVKFVVRPRPPRETKRPPEAGRAEACFAWQLMPMACSGASKTEVVQPEPPQVTAAPQLSAIRCSSSDRQACHRAEFAEGRLSAVPPSLRSVFLGTFGSGWRPIPMSTSAPPWSLSPCRRKGRA